MAARTYVPTLRRLLERLSVYLARWTPLIIGNLSDLEAAELLAFQIALAELIAALGPDSEAP